MKSKNFCFLLVILFLGFFSCGPKILVPPEIDLKAYSSVGIFQFSTNSKGKLGKFTTNKFLEEIQESQKGARFIELGELNEVLNEMGKTKLNVEAIQEIGKKYDVDCFITGDLDVSDIKPKVNLSSILSSMSVSAEVDAQLTVKLLETDKSATRWLDSARHKKSVAHVSVFSAGDIYFDADDPEKAYGQLVRSLVREVSEDLRFRYVRKKD